MKANDRIYIPPRRRQLPIDHYRPDVMLGALVIGIVAALAVGVLIWAIRH